ncbi:hypothetical protein CLIB1444_03S03884 [[Candida] jaroonii]|uniref:Uncharacterized protein n=1 Tax=[Candida] jaroonii TaxID=467808 RepID=A0ACA9Y4Z8_9ASCO|nr:hypothetical protein CLIB1444_03S03884 [[Candida] jaroonii]
MGEEDEELDDLLFGSSINLIPSLIDLYEEIPMMGSITEYLSVQISRFQPSVFKTFLTELYNQWNTLVEIGKIDREIRTQRLNNSKSIILSSIFGSFFTDALSIISHKGVGMNKGMVVVTETSHEYKLDRKSEEKLIEFDFNELLSPFDLVVNQGQIVPLTADIQSEKKPHISGEINQRSYFVQLENWYCSCEGYQRCYTRSWLDSSSTVDHRLDFQMDELKFIKFDDLDPIPMCSHLMATLIVRLNNLPLNEINHLPSQIT